MWRRTALIVAIGLTSAAPIKLTGQECVCPDLLISDLNWVRFDVVMGRLVAVTNRAKQDRQRARRELPCGTAESLAIAIDRGLTSLQYTLESDTQQLTIRVVRRDEIDVRWTRRQPDVEGATMVYSQVPGADVRISICSADGSESVFQAPSLWHLAVGEPGVRDLYILDVLKTLKPDWHPLCEAQQIRTTLVETKPWQVRTSIEEVRTLVRQLADPDFRTRQLADRELRSRGRGVLCLLEGLDGKQLDGEQRMRIREIRHALIGRHSDTPDRVAAWLINDKFTWLALMNHDDVQNRRAARAHLARIVDQKVEFDPVAGPAVRSQQLAALRSQIVQR